VIRPPSEAGSLIVQVSLGCSDNRCNFCPAYKQKPFQIKSLSRIRQEFEEAARAFPHTRRIFLADGDAVVLPQQSLETILSWAGENFPKLNRVGIYGSAKSLEKKSVEELKRLRTLKLGILYLGIETGDPDVYRWTEKAGSPETNIQECLKVKQAGIRLNTTVILGLGGQKRSPAHALKTAQVLNAIRPEQIAALTLMIVPGTRIHEQQLSGEFQMPGQLELIREMHTLIEHLEDFRCQFFSNHASNYLPVTARFPKDKAGVCATLARMLEHRDLSALRPDFFRAL